MAKTAGF